MADKIARLEKGKTPSLLSAEKGNELIDTINSLQGMTVSPQGTGSLVSSKNNTVLDLSPIRTLLDQLALQVANLMNGLDGTDGGSEAITNLQNQIDTIKNRLDNASISMEAFCNPDSTITINATLNI